MPADESLPANPRGDQSAGWWRHGILEGRHSDAPHKTVRHNNGRKCTKTSPAQDPSNAANWPWSVLTV